MNQINGMAVQQTIKMIARNPHSRNYEDVHPEDGIAVERMRPLFWSNAAQAHVYIPGYEAADVYDAWLARFESAA